MQRDMKNVLADHRLIATVFVRSYFLDHLKVEVIIPLEFVVNVSHHFFCF